MQFRIEPKRESFLFIARKRRMVHGEFYPFRSVGKDTEAIQLVSKLKQATGRDDGMFMAYYAQRLVYTENLTFDWHPDTPAWYTNLERFWQMVKDGEPPEECYLFCVENIHNIVLNEWGEALENAHRIWIPEEEDWAAEPEEGEVPDPN